MVLNKLYGLKGTGISLNERFTILSSSVPHQPNDAYMQPNIRNRGYLQIADRLELGNRHVLSQRLGMNESGRLRRTGSLSTLPGLKRSNSYSSLNQERNVKQRIGWRQPKRNLSRSASLNNLAGLFSGVSPQPAYRRRAAAQRVLRSKFGDGQDFYRIQTAAQQLLELAGVQVPYFVNRGNSRGGARGAARGSARGAAWGGARGGAKGPARGPVRPGAKGSARGGPRGRGRIRGRGGAPRNNPAPMVTKEELDAQLEQYMAGSKAALDRELETYMKNAMDLE